MKKKTKGWVVITRRGNIREERHCSALAIYRRKFDAEIEGDSDNGERIIPCEIILK